jgi:hypothetical protein
MQRKWDGGGGTPAGSEDQGNANAHGFLDERR